MEISSCFVKKHAHWESTYQFEAMPRPCLKITVEDTISYENCVLGGIALIIEPLGGEPIL